MKELIIIEDLDWNFSDEQIFQKTTKEEVEIFEEDLRVHKIESDSALLSLTI